MSYKRKNITVKTLSMLLILTMLFTSLFAATVVGASDDTKIIEYTVQKGDTLYSISTYFGVNREVVLEQNGITNRAVISVGQVLKIEVPLTEEEKQAKEEQVPVKVEEPIVEPVVIEPVVIQEVVIVEEEIDAKAPLGITFADNTVFTADKGEKIDFVVKEADIRDILSLFAIKLDVNIIYIGAPYETSFEITEVDATTAFEIFLKSSSTTGTGLSYIRENDLVIVGPSDVIADSFSERLVLTEFKLQYMDPNDLIEYLSQLGVELNTLILNQDSNILIAQGLPYEIAKANEIINTLDKAEYYDTAEMGTVEPSIELVPYYLQHVSSETIKSVLSTFGVGITTFTMSATSDVLWVSGTLEEHANLKEVISKVDVASNKTDNEFGVYRLKYVEIDAINSAMLDLGLGDIIEEGATTTSIPTTILSEEPYVILINFTYVNKEMVDFLIAEIDTPANRTQIPKVFVYTFNNITAQTATDRIDTFKSNMTFDLDNVIFYDLGYMGYTRQLVVLTTNDEESLVRSFLSEIDFESEIVKIVVDQSTDASGHTLLKNRIATVSYLAGVNENNFYLTGNLTKTSGSYVYILWFEDTAENSRKVQEVIAMIDAGTGEY